MNIRLFDKNISLRLSLLVLSLLSLLPIALFAGYAIVQVHQQQRLQVLDEFQRKTVILGEKVEARLTTAIHLLEGLASSNAAKDQRWEDLYQIARRVMTQHVEFRAITLVDANENVVFLSTLPYGSKVFNTNYSNLVQEAIQTGKPNASGPFVTRVSPDKLLAVTVPIQSETNRSFALRMILSTNEISDILAHEGLNPGWLAIVTDREGILLARNKDAEAYIGRRSSATFFEAVKRKERGMFPSVTLEGVSITSAIYLVFGGDWFLGLAVPNDLLDAPLHQQVLRFAAVALGCLLLALGLSQWLAARIAEQILSASAVNSPSP